MARRATRRSQSVVPFGIGSIVEFEDEALMPAGLDAWPPEAPHIQDDRLARRLGVDHFRMPPPKPEIGAPAGATAPLPYVRFPDVALLSPLSQSQERRSLRAYSAPLRQFRGVSRSRSADPHALRRTA